MFLSGKVAGKDLINIESFPLRIYAYLGVCVLQVANDDLCLNLQAAYDLTPKEYDEVRNRPEEYDEVRNRPEEYDEEKVYLIRRTRASGATL